MNQAEIQEWESRPSQLAGLLLDVLPLAIRELRKEICQNHDRSLTVPQFRILAHLFCEAATNKALAESVGVSVAATSRMVALLVKRGLVERTVGEKDKREVALALSAKGRRQFETVRETARARLTTRLARVPNKELEHSVRGLKSLEKILNEKYLQL